MKSKSFVYATAPDSDTALKLAHSAIKAGLAACCNIIPGMTSVYEWQGRGCEGHEVCYRPSPTFFQEKEEPGVVRLDRFPESFGMRRVNV